MFNPNNENGNLDQQAGRYDLDLNEMAANANYVLGQIDEIGFDEEVRKKRIDGPTFTEKQSSWINWDTVVEAENIRVNGLENRIGKHNGRYDETKGVIRFPNEAIAVVWMEEILRQISDGVWKKVTSDWGKYWGMKVEVDESLTRPEIEDVYITSLNFLDTATKYRGMLARMIFYVRASRVEEGYTETSLVTDLTWLDNWVGLERMSEEERRQYHKQKQSSS